MKDGVRILNFARGELVVGADLAKAVEGGIIGCIIWGMRRSVQANEAGVGSAPIAYEPSGNTITVPSAIPWSR